LTAFAGEAAIPTTATDASSVSKAKSFFMFSPLLDRRRAGSTRRPERRGAVRP
jgi:hypothetical protein